MNSPRSILVKELSARHRSRILKHLLALDEHDRRLRFGAPVPDESIALYVKGINFEVDKVFGVFSFRFNLIGVGHLSFLSGAGNRFIDGKMAELGISVSKRARGLGVGSSLVARATMHCRNANVTTLFVHCLSSNNIMMHLAKKEGMEIHQEFGEADAYLTIPESSPFSILQEAMQEQAATIDYSMKSNTGSVIKLLKKVRTKKVIHRGK